VCMLCVCMCVCARIGYTLILDKNAKCFIFLLCFFVFYSLRIEKNKPENKPEKKEERKRKPFRPHPPAPNFPIPLVNQCSPSIYPLRFTFCFIFLLFYFPIFISLFFLFNPYVFLPKEIKEYGSRPFLIVWVRTKIGET